MMNLFSKPETRRFSGSVERVNCVSLASSHFPDKDPNLMFCLEGDPVLYQMRASGWDMLCAVGDRVEGDVSEVGRVMGSSFVNLTLKARRQRLEAQDPDA